MLTFLLLTFSHYHMTHNAQSHSRHTAQEWFTSTKRLQNTLAVVRTVLKADIDDTVL